MLVLQIKKEQRVFVGNSSAFVQLLGLQGESAKLGFVFPRDVQIVRDTLVTEPQTPVADAKEASYAAICEYLERPDYRNGIVLFWTGISMREMFEKGAEWERNR